MSKTLLKNVKIAGADKFFEAADILISGKIIELVSEKDINVAEADEIFDFERAAIGLPGFIDIHNHGAVGFDVNASDTENLIEIGKFLAREGVSAWLPTLVPDAPENYRKVIEAIDELSEIQSEFPIAQALGVHYEGVFANEKMCGALRPEFFKSYARGDEISAMPGLKKGVHLTTLAPEVENGIDLIKDLIREGWIVSIGHTAASVEILEEALKSGAEHLTHFYNAMTGLHHRNLGTVGWALANKDVTFDIIADGIHVHPKMLEFAVKNKTAEKVTLISDSVLPTGLGDGEFEIWGEKISVRKGKTQNRSGTIAGSVITMLDAFKLMRSNGFGLADVSRMSSLNPARVLKLDEERGSISEGKRADLILLDEKENLIECFIGGRKISEN